MCSILIPRQEGGGGGGDEKGISPLSEDNNFFHLRLEKYSSIYNYHMTLTDYV